MGFPDGAPPPEEVVEKCLAVTDELTAKDGKPAPCIAIHCVAGLGR